MCIVCFSTVKKTDKKVSSDVVDCRDIDPYINWDNVSVLTVLRTSYSRIVPRKGKLFVTN